MNFEIKKNNGFTLIELMIAMLISSIVIGGIYLVYQSQNESYHTQERVVEIQQNLRAAMFVMIKEIRMAGYDPTGDADTSLTAGDGSNGNPLSFTMLADNNGLDDDKDNNGDGNIDENGELRTVRYDLYDSSLDSDSTKDDLARKVDNGNRELLVGNIDTLNFVYLDENGNTTADTEGIRSIQITIIARSENEDPDFTDNKIYKNQQGNEILNKSTAPDHYHRRMLSYEVKCRNLGL